ncbi:UNVERIFIED_CONTAM: hypothetical protein Sradi_4422400 [Sesamum radiatum]|uniref:MULE transposase domain-containing protein n=1 Tax=Sesamum radiatum TaxID=300843 RepID=A0AAW2NTS2_SESRA
MSASSSRIDILVYFGGEISENDWDSLLLLIPYMSLLATHGFPSTSNTDFLGSISNPDFCTDEGSEPDEVEFPIPLENGPNDVDINVIAEEFAQGQVKCNLTFAIKHVIQAVKDHTGYDILYQKAWYSLKMVREIVYGTWESSVQKLSKYMAAVQKYNRGTIVEWKHKALHPTGAYVLGYVFWAFKLCIEGFKFCRKIISVDGTHLYTKYKHKMLIAATMDGNKQVLPLAFTIVDDESYASWKWFLQQLSRHVIRGRRGVCHISDRHAGIIKAVNESSDLCHLTEFTGIV